ncbi:MAG: hypothetical protein ABI222_01560 [Opitutaceae bacterium]
MTGQRLTKHSGFTLVDVMMGATILVVGLVGLIEAVLIGSEMQATARRQTTASQIVSNEIELLRLQDWATISALPAGTTSLAAWNGATLYHITDLVSFGGSWFRCIASNTGQSTANLSYWAIYSGPIASTGIDSAATFGVSRTVATGPNGLVEMTFTVTWVTKPSGSPVSRTYTRIATAYFGQYGLNLTYRRT